MIHIEIKCYLSGISLLRCECTWKGGLEARKTHVPPDKWRQYRGTRHWHWRGDEPKSCEAGHQGEETWWREIQKIHMVVPQQTWCGFDSGMFVILVYVWSNSTSSEWDSMSIMFWGTCDWQTQIFSLSGMRAFHNLWCMEILREGRRRSQLWQWLYRCMRNLYLGTRFHTTICAPEC